MRKSNPGAAPYVPALRTLESLRSELDGCRGCQLYLRATQGVFGEGPSTARIVLAGEQPGDEEDQRGAPFVGPAGRILNRALADAGIDRSAVYVTNAVKHFKFEERGKRRIHKKPGATEVSACRPWLEAEVGAIKPAVIVCLGATAAQTILGKEFRVTEQRGQPIEHPWASFVVATVHPSAILRVQDADQRHAEYARFVADLQTVHAFL